MGFGFCAISLFAVCAKEATPLKVAQELAYYPGWVLAGSTADSRSLYGVGIESYGDNVKVTQMRADNRAKAEISLIFEHYTESLCDNYLATVGKGDADQRLIEQALRSLVAAMLSNIQITNRWVDPRDGTIYSLASLDLDEFQQKLIELDELSFDMRNFIKKNGIRPSKLALDVHYACSL
jgi:hypothetical protein